MGEKTIRIGVDIGGMSIKFGLVDDENHILAKKVIKTRLDVEPEEVIKEMGETAISLLQENKYTVEQCRGLGMGSPGTIDDKAGVILYSNNFNWEDVAIIPELKKYLDVPMGIANDADAAALGEVVAGAGKGSKNAILITLGTGVGGGVILNGEIFHGPLSGGCELGHTVIEADGVQCTCGRKGCLESYASATALMRMARDAVKKYPDSMLAELCETDPEKINGKMPFDAQKAGDQAGCEVVDTYENYLSIGIANFINIFRPETIILGGGVAAQKEYLTDELQRRVNTMCFGGEHGQIAKITTSELGNDAGIIGAANLVR